MADARLAPRRGNMVSAAEIAAYNSSLALACDELAGVRRLDATPFARGFSKAAWRGVLRWRQCRDDRAVAVQQATVVERIAVALHGETAALPLKGGHVA